MENHKIYSTAIPKLFYVFGIATVIGTIADWLLLSSTLQDMNIGSAVAALVPSAIQGVVAISTSFILGFCICLLGIVFMFKSGSSSVEVRVKKLWKIHIEYFLILIWFVLGLGLALLRAETGTEDHTFELAILLLVLYLGTGVTGYLLGQMLGNPYLSKYRKIVGELNSHHKNDLQNCYDELVESNNNCLQIQRDVEKVLAKYLTYYNLIDTMVEEFGAPSALDSVQITSVSPVESTANTIIDPVRPEPIPQVGQTLVDMPHSFEPQNPVHNIAPQTQNYVQPTFIDPIQHIQDLNDDNNTIGDNNGR